jgi:hypothetical protein
MKKDADGLSDQLTEGEIAHRAAAINREIAEFHGVACQVGFEWQGLFIHNPFADPQHGASGVDPVQQYGGAYLSSIFVTDPAKALEIASRQLRDAANKDLVRYCVDHNLDVPGIISTVEAIWDLRVPDAEELLESLTDEQVAHVWAHVDEIVKTKVGTRRAER